MTSTWYSGSDCPFSHDEKAKATALKSRQASADDAVPEEGFKGLKKAPKDSKTVRWQQVITLGRGPASWSEVDDASGLALYSSSGSGSGSDSASAVTYSSGSSSSLDVLISKPTVQLNCGLIEDYASDGISETDGLSP